MNADLETHRPFLHGLAYRMLGSVTETEDVLQDAWLRWREVAHAEITNPRAFLARIVTNLCLDHLTSARAQREHYVGQWLPEPLPGDAPQIVDPAELVELASDLSFALLQTLERLSPLERAAFLLHDIFEFDFAAVAHTLARSEDSCRQLAARARHHVRAARPRYRVSREAGTRMSEAFVQAITEGDTTALAALLAEDVVFYSDGGGMVAAVPKPLFGAAQVARVIMGFASLYQPGEIIAEATWMNGAPSFILRTRAGETLQTLTLEPTAEGSIAALYIQRNPQKLHHLAQPAGAEPR